MVGGSTAWSTHRPYEWSAAIGECGGLYRVCQLHYSIRMTTAVRAAQAAYLAAHLGLCQSVALAWCDKENGVGNNILGVEDRPGHLAVYATWQAGLDAAIERIDNSPYYAGIRASLLTHDPIKQRQAIIDSPWSGTHYAGGFPQVPAGVCAPLAAPRHDAEVTIPTAIWNDAEQRWVYNGVNRLGIGTRLVVRGHAYVKAGVPCYPAVAPPLYANYYVPVAHVRLIT